MAKEGPLTETPRCIALPKGEGICATLGDGETIPVELCAIETEEKTTTISIEYHHLRL